MSSQLAEGTLCGLKLGVLKEGFEAADADPKVNELVRETVERLRGLVVEVRECSVNLNTKGHAVILPEKVSK